MELELKHLAPYLPYELKLYGSSDIWLIHSLGVEDICIANGLHTQTLSFDDCITDYLPILRPLSQLKEVVCQAMSNINTDMSVAIEISEFANKKIILHNLSYGAYEELLRNHYDIFGLIDAGIAIDINMLSV